MIFGTELGQFLGIIPTYSFIKDSIVIRQDFAFLKNCIKLIQIYLNNCISVLQYSMNFALSICFLRLS